MRLVSHTVNFTRECMCVKLIIYAKEENDAPERGIAGADGSQYSDGKA